MELKWSSIGAVVVLTAAIVTLLFRDSLFAAGWAAITVQILAALLMLWARSTFGRRSFHAAANPTEGGLITSGPYRFVRHPIYAAVLFFLWAGALSHLSPVNAALAALASGGLAVRALAEEQLVVRRYPEYTAYAARTKRFIPFLF